MNLSVDEFGYICAGAMIGVGLTLAMVAICRAANRPTPKPTNESIDDKLYQVLSDRNKTFTSEDH